MPQVLRVGNPKKRRIAGDVVTDLKTLRASVLTREPAAGDPQRAGKAWQYLQSPGRQASGLTYENSPDDIQWRWVASFPGWDPSLCSSMLSLLSAS